VVYNDEAYLKELVKQYILKRTKKGLQIPMPSLTEETITVEWSNKAEEQVNAVLQSRLGYGKKMANIPQSTCRLTDMLRARQMCVLPKLLEAELHKNRENQTSDDYQHSQSNHQDQDETDDPELFENGIQGSSKLDAVVKHIRSNSGNRKLVFCEYTKEMDYLEAKLHEHHIITGRIDGSTSQSLRQTYLKSDFIDVLILQVKTCSEGLNLQSFTDVYIVTPQWNPCTEAQAICRSYRLGQTQPVRVFRFVMSFAASGLTKSVERHAQNRQMEKMETAESVTQYAE
jgi:SNF2 family DNA or RNA helicase